VNAASAMVQGAELRTRRPAPQLVPLLGCFWWVDIAQGTRFRTFPDACTSISIIVRQDAPAESYFIGPRLVPREGTPSIGHSLFGVRLKPGAAFLFTRTSVHELVGERRKLADLVPDEAVRFEQRLRTALSVDQRFDALEELMLSRLAGGSMHPCVQKAIEIVEQTGGQIRIAELARCCGFSTRGLGRLLRTWVGLSPKTLARVTRFQKFLEQMETEPNESSAARAVDLGYFDQAHLTKEVAQFFGATPGRMSPHHVAGCSKTRCE